MDLIQIIILALIQGVTEFLPISSSGHLALVPFLTGWPDQGLAFDVAVHVGTLIAVLWYFREELVLMTRGWFAGFGGDVTADGRLAWLVLLATVPIGIAGLLFADVIETHARTPKVIAVTTILFGALLWLADVTGKRARDEQSLRWMGALAIGLAQVLALVPGTSRSGITMTAGLALGLTREACARFSFLLSIPAIAMAGGYETVQLLGDPEPVAWGSLLLAVVFSAISAYLCIRLFLRFVTSTGMAPFALYRIALGIVILYAFS
ncbi:MAG: undecaprenyl-diphosphate phosphatase [Gammaproteobacteria bacterium]